MNIKGRVCIGVLFAVLYVAGVWVANTELERGMDALGIYLGFIAACLFGGACPVLDD